MAIEEDKIIWKLVLANSSTMVNIGELQNVSNKQLELVLNRPGSCSFRMPMSHELAGAIEEGTTCIKAYRQTPSGIQLIWSGPVWQIQDIGHQDVINVSCAGWFEILNHRFLRYEKSYQTGTLTAGQIAIDLLNIANAQKDGPTSQAFPDGNGTIRPTGIVAGTSFDTQLRSRLYQQWQNIGQAIIEWSDIENGYDYEITPDTKTLNIYPNAFPGILRRDRPQAQFGYKWGPDNLLEFERTIEMGTLVNSQFSAGQLNTLALDQNTTSMDKYGLFEDVQVINDVSSVPVLQAFSDAEVAVKSFPKVVYRILPHPFLLNSEHVPEPFVDYRIGDHVYVTSNQPPRLVVNKQAMRVYGISVTIDENGSEKISSLQVSP
jgi:hypothetical protein